MIKNKIIIPKNKQEVVIDNIKNLIGWILIVSLMLCLCVSVDYADNTSVIHKENSTYGLDNKSIIVVNKTIINEQNSTIVPSSSDKIHKIKAKKIEKPKISITAKPSCGCRHSYRWHKSQFIDYCPHCHSYGVLRNVHKPQAKYEQELTCLACGADYCGVCGKEKYSWSRYYLTKIS